MVEKETRDAICHAMHRYAEANNKYTKRNYEKNIKWSYYYPYNQHVFRWKQPI